jgi:cyclopropane fatty-acyl-phospholipid synthase-like methyltransferase
MIDLSNLSPVHLEPTVVNCYDFFDRLIPAGMTDLTDGIYHGDESLSYEQAQENQANWLLDQVGCTERSRILGIGCGNGRLLAVERRGAKPIGVTIRRSNCRRVRGLDMRLLNYRELGEGWNGRFDGIVANGSIEHFVQPRDVAAGRMDQIHREHRPYGPAYPRPDACHR